jgi:hypothetical protein
VVKASGEQALAWASYVLYGDPEARPLKREGREKLSIPTVAKIAARASAPWKRPGAGEMRSAAREAKEAAQVSGPEKAGGSAAAGGSRPVRRRRWTAWLPAALSGGALGAFGVALIAWWLGRKPPMPAKTALRGVAVLALAASAAPEDTQRARSIEWCLPEELIKNHLPVVPPEKLMTLQAQTGGALDKSSARQMGLAVGARWVLYGNVTHGAAHVQVSQVLDDFTVYEETLALDSKDACARFAAKLAERLQQEQPAP